MKKEFSNLDDIYKLSIIKIEIEANYTLLLTYSNNEMIKYSLENILKNKLEVLKDINLFKKVFIDEFGNVAWNIDDNIDSNTNWDNRIDISKETIYLDGDKIK
jgi:S-adenosylmethionine hydrolase